MNRYLCTDCDDVVQLSLEDELATCKAKIIEAEKQVIRLPGIYI